MSKKKLVYPYEGYSSSGSDADYEQPNLKMQEELWSEIDFRIEEEYQKVMSNALYWNDRLKKSERITKFNFEEVAEDKTFLDHHFESIHQKIWHRFKLELTLEESILLNENVLDKLYELLEEDVQDLRREQLPI